MRLSCVAAAASSALLAAAAPAQAGLVGSGNTVEAFFSFDAPAPTGGGCNQYATGSNCEWQYDFDSQSFARYTLPIPAHFVQAPNAGVTIDVADNTITITNQIPATFCADGTSSGSACTDPFTGFEFVFSSGVDITGATVDSSSAADFRPNGVAPHQGIHLISSTDFSVDLTGAAPAIGDKLVLDIATPGTIPEPSTWAMMALGFAGLGFAGWRRAAAAARAA